VDAFIDVHGARDENDAAQMTKVSAAIKCIVREHHCLMVLIDHTRKNQQGDGIDEGLMAVRGSSEKVATVDTVITVRRGHGGVLTVRHPKPRFAEPVPAFQVRVEDNEEKTATKVEYLGEVDAARREEKLKRARDIVYEVMPSGEAQPATYFIEKGKARGATESDITRALTEAKNDEQVVTEEVPTGKPGRKPIHYRLRSSTDVSFPPDQED